MTNETWKQICWGQPSAKVLFDLKKQKRILERESSFPSDFGTPLCQKLMKLLQSFWDLERSYIKFETIGLKNKVKYQKKKMCRWWCYEAAELTNSGNTVPLDFVMREYLYHLSQWSLFYSFCYNYVNWYAYTVLLYPSQLCENVQQILMKKHRTQVVFQFIKQVSGRAKAFSL